MSLIFSDRKRSPLMRELSIEVGADRGEKASLIGSGDAVSGYAVKQTRTRPVCEPQAGAAGNFCSPLPSPVHKKVAAGDGVAAPAAAKGNAGEVRI